MSTTLESKPHDTSYYIKSIIGLAVMVFFGMLPAPAPITQTGMMLLGQFIGLVFLWTFVDMVWPTFAAILMFGFIAVDVYPNSFALASIYEAGQQSIGNWVTVIIICLLLISDVLDECGLIRRIALWFITRKIAKSSPWGFTFMIMLATLVLGLFMDNSAVQVLMFALATELFAIIGTKPEEKWGKVVAIGITFTTVMSCGITPICHTMPILFMGIYSAIAGTSVNWISYMAITIPAALIMWAAMLLFFRFIIKPDMSKLKTMDYAKVEALRPGPMSAKEKFVAVTFVILVICWIVPGLLDVLAPTWAVTLWLDNNTTMLSPMLIIITLYAIVRFDGKPVLDIPKACTRISWLMVFLLAGIMMIASAFGEDTTGISAWVLENLTPLVSGLSPYATVAILCALTIILTNIANNIPVGIVFVTIGVPLSLEMGINPLLTASAISVCSVLAFTIPPAFVPIGICYAYPYGGAKYTLRWGLVMCLVCIIVAAIVIYPLGVLFT
ncbi:MAG: anion permease [Oscillospiraceae bacterium]|nr:anion permease [Oscillospiraceae bacterium]